MTNHRKYNAWLGLVGFGEQGWNDLGTDARTWVQGADVLVAGSRHFRILDETRGLSEAETPHTAQTRVVWDKSTGGMLAQIEQLKNRFDRVCVLATGDPMCFGIGASLSRQIPAEDMIVIPGPSAFSLMAARLCWPLMDCLCLTLHGRAIEQIHRHLMDDVRLLLLSADEKTPAAVAGLLRRRGFGASRMTLFEHMGGADEKQVAGTAEHWLHPPGARFNALAVEGVAGPEATVYAQVPGLRDDAFAHDGKMTKRLVRAATLALLAPLPGQLLWDLGAGSGSVAIEWMRAAPRTTALAIDRVAHRLERVRDNARRLGVPDLQTLQGDLPHILEDPRMMTPDAIFIGGGITIEGLFEQCLARLKPGGRLVANAVTLESEARLLDWHKNFGGTLNRLNLGHADPVGSFHGWRSTMPVTQYALCTKR